MNHCCIKQSRWKKKNAKYKLKKSFWKNPDKNSIQSNTSEKYQEIKKQCIDPKIFEAEEIKHRKHFSDKIGTKVIPEGM
jgi:hypothetical protein